MRNWIAFLLAFVALFCCAFAVPSSPTGLNAEFVEHGIKISWQHAGGNGVSFNVYRGSSIESAIVIANVSENFFVDKTAALDKNYFYFVKSADAGGESSRLGSVFVESIEPGEKPFAIKLVAPEQKTFDLGTANQIDFVLAIESKNFDALKDLKAVLVNNDFGTRENFVFDAQKRLFSLSAKLPEKQASQAILTTYTIFVTATVNGQQVSESTNYTASFTPKSDVNVMALIQNYLPFVFVPFILGITVFVLWRLFLQRQVERDRWWGELFAARRSRAMLRNDLANGRRTQEQFNEEDYILQGKINEAEVKLGLTKKGSLSQRPNPLEGCSPGEIEEIRVLANIMQPKKKEMTQEDMRLYLVKNNKSEKVAKKVAEIVYEGKPQATTVSK